MQSQRWPGLILLVALIPAMNFLFQNCGSSPNSNGGASLFSAASYGADLVWNSNEIKNISVNEFKQVERWLDFNNELVGLYPPLRINSQSLEIEKSPLLEKDENDKSILNFKDRKNLRTINEDLRVFLSDKYTVGFFVKNVEFPSIDPINVRVFDLMSPNGVSDGYIGVDVTPTQVSAFYWFGQTSYRFAAIDITNDELKNGLGVLVRLGPDYESMALSVNGRVAEQYILTTTPPPLLGFVTRQLQLNSPEGNGGFHLYEFALWRSALSDSELAEYSKAYYESYVLGLKGNVKAPSDAGQNGGAFTTVATVFNKSRGGVSCVGCHGSISQKSWLLSQKSNDNLWVVPNDSAASQLIKALRHLSGATAMPRSGGAIPEDEIKVIEDWINNGAK